MKKHILWIFILLISAHSQSQSKTINAIYGQKGFYICLNTNGLALFIGDGSDLCLDECYQYEISNDTIIIGGDMPFLQNDDRLCWFNWNKREFEKKRHGMKLMSAKEIEKFYEYFEDRLKNYNLRITNGILETIPDN
ncbi:MAG: hypothetical protein IKO46_11935 [Salinivirgaceae bacterium]|nr:hypothetical protein [Salinivirgaceae bacterium]